MEDFGSAMGIGWGSGLLLQYKRCVRRRARWCVLLSILNHKPCRNSYLAYIATVRDGNAQLLSDRVENMPTVDRVVEERRKRAAEAAVARTPTAPIQTSPSMQTSENTIPADAVEDAATPQAGSPEELEEEAESEGAFNPETGEINWDCPCLGGMAHGPCGEEFKAAFSCFVYSEQEPKGMDCIEKFK